FGAARLANLRVCRVGLVRSSAETGGVRLLGLLRGRPGVARRRDQALALSADGAPGLIDLGLRGRDARMAGPESLLQLGQVVLRFAELVAKLGHGGVVGVLRDVADRSEEHTSELQ